MRRNVFARAISLLVVYSAVILGLFVLQFRSDSVISEKIGKILVTLSSGKNERGENILKNKMSVSFNGIIFSCDDTNPIVLLSSSHKDRVPVNLLAWTKLDPLTCEFLFSEDVKLTFAVSDETNKAHLSVKATIPSGYQTLRLPYELYNSTFVVSQGTNHLQLDVRNTDWELNASSISDSAISFTSSTPLASYAHFDKTNTFSFESIVRYAGADYETYSKTIHSLSQNLINAFAAQVQSDKTITEQDAISYVAAMANQNKYNEALDMVPSSFKKGVNRTYLSSPYFDSLASMNRTLEQQMNSFSDIINQGTLDAFTVLYIEDYMCMHPASSAVKNLLSSASNVDEKSLTVMQAVGILRVYEKLLSHNEELSLLLSGALDKCVNKLSASCIAEDNALTVSENGTFVSVVQAAEIGSALIKYGKASGKNALMSAGYLIINSYLQENSSFDLRTLSAVYPYVAYENKFLPHFELLGFDRSGAVYAWTCANEMSFQKDESGATVLKIDFPETYTHYLIINGILPFRTIYIYDISFRTDPRFETYNSSGYVYNANTGTMLLKSRHKSKIETVRLVHGSASQSGSSTTSTSSQAATSTSTVQDAQSSSASE